jgi:polar amino acid transport system substrate-binding protein
MRGVLAPLVALGVLVAGCGPAEPVVAPPDRCTEEHLETLYPGVFTIATDQPVYPPWYFGDNPSSNSASCWPRPAP